ncbi:unnamed protein product [Prorocentrum cordatum]|uniref:DUF202 domain-containing protein n=1 Tax=Prorocentrum cordatum TaxID=2364126 RepID=A0ABN9YGZ7_9DINO|nr:unnamed protein product [Polarella glacialis]
MPRVEVATFRQWDIDLLLLALGQLHERRRQQLRPLGAGGSPAGPSPEQLRREGDGDEAETPAVETYLVPPDMLMRVKVSLLKHLQVDAPSQGHSPPPSSSVVGRARHVRVASDGRGGLGQGSIRQSTGEVYFDGPGGELCGERLPVGTSTAEPSRVPAAFCCRWVGDATGGTEVDFFVDVQGASGGTTAVPLKQRDLAAFATGSLQGRSESEPLHRVQAAIRERSLRPSVRATFRRSTFAAFGDPGSEVVAWTTVDEDLVFYDEPEGSDSAAWCQSLPGGTRPLPDRRIACEQAVLRVCRGRSGPRGPGPSAATGGPHDEELEWPEELRALKLRRAHGFSKALHGTALLRGELAPVRPAWLHEGVPGSCSEGSPSTPAGTPSERPAAAAAGSRALAPGPSAGSQAAPAAAPAAASASPPRPPGWCRTAAAAAAQGARRLCARRAPVELRVDPKVPLAIERTALAWMRSAALLSGLSQLLLSSDDQISQLNGFLVALVALTFAFWPVVDFRRAALRLREASGKGHQPKVNRLLPQVLSGLLAFVLVAILLVDVLFNDAE